jgi:hypothetical protein
MSLNINTLWQYGSISLTQNLNVASKTDMVLLSTQSPPPELPRIPGSGREHIVQIAPDFDAPLDFGA